MTSISGFLVSEVFVRAEYIIGSKIEAFGTRARSTGRSRRHENTKEKLELGKNKLIAGEGEGEGLKEEWLRRKLGFADKAKKKVAEDGR